MDKQQQSIDQPGIPRDTAIVLSILWLAGLGGIGFIDPLYMVVYAVGSGATLLFAIYPIIGLYAMALTYPFIQLEITYGAFNAPVVDVVAVLALAGWACRIVWFLITDRSRLKEIRFPLLVFFLIWVAAASLSLLNTYDLALSGKYIARPLAFFYLAYIFLTVNTLQSQKVLWHILFIFFGIGVVVALYGLYGFMVVDVPSFFDRRAVPVNIFGANPLGGNQNIISDIMVTTIPIGFFLMLHLKSLTRQKIVFIGLLLMVGVNLITFSRSGWLALLVMLVALVILQYRHYLKRIAKYTIMSLVIALPLFAYMFVFSSSEQVQSSNVNRLLLNDIALEMFLEYPLFGQGAGTFFQAVENNPLYIKEFGAPLDAHGFIQKIGAELGVVGLLAYTLFLFVVIRMIYKEYKKHDRSDDWSYLLVSMLIMVVGTIFFQLFQTSYFVAKLWLPVGLALATVYLAREQQPLRMSAD